jgi:hypothetical protein
MNTKFQEEEECHSQPFFFYSSFQNEKKTFGKDCSEMVEFDEDIEEQYLDKTRLNVTANWVHFGNLLEFCEYFVCSWNFNL